VLLVKNDPMVTAVKVQPDAVAGTVQITVLCDETDGSVEAGRGPTHC
jgi:hypothetical protein